MTAFIVGIVCVGGGGGGGAAEATAGVLAMEWCCAVRLLSH